ncbi:LysR family transcriptional regulator [Labrys neptuniae]
MKRHNLFSMAKQSALRSEIDLFEGIPQFLAVARNTSFRAAARELGVTPGAISQSVKSLERRLGAPLFIRSTRHVALTDAGSVLADRIGDVRSVVADAIRQIEGLQDRPVGILRLCMRRLAFGPIIGRALPKFRSAHPNVAIDIEVRDGPIDLIAEGFDAAVRIGEYLEPDMLAVRIGRPFHWVVVGSPNYLAERGTPKTPSDLLNHDCIGYRIGGEPMPYQWEFRNRDRDLRVRPSANLIVNDAGALCALAEQGMGLAYTSDNVAEEALREKRLRKVLSDYMPSEDALYLYFPAGNRNEPKLRAFVDTIIASRDL